MLKKILKWNAVMQSKLAGNLGDCLISVVNGRII